MRGEDLDARTDIFSLGTVLYEMASGKLPFVGKTSGLVFKAILDGTPSAPTSLNPALPEQLDAIVSKALEKDRDLRYQSAADLRTDLKRVKRDTESAEHAPTGRTEAIRRETSRWSWAQWAAGAAVAAVVAGAGFGGWWHARRTQAPPGMVERQITFNAPENYVSDEAISPDGKYLAYSDSSGLHLRVIASGEEHSLPEPAAGTLCQIGWFPDGNTLLLSTAEESVTQTVWALSIFGGNPTKLRSGIGGVGADAVSPDGSQIVFEKKLSGNEIWLMDAHGENPRLLLVDKDHLVSSPAWSPDGRYVVYLGLDRASQSRFGGKVEVWDIQRGSATEIVSDPNLADNALLWNHNWQVIFALSEPIDLGQSRNFGLWKIDIDPATGRARGKAAHITKWTGYDTDDLSATQDSKILSALKTGKSLDVYIGTLAANGSRLEKTQRLTFQHGIDEPASWTSDSSAILLSSNRNGAFNIFRQNIHQQTAERMFGSADTNAAGGRITPDDAWTLYWSLPKGESASGTGAMRLMRAPVSGGSPEVVLETKLEADVDARCPSRRKSSCILSERKAKELSFYELDPLHGKGREVARCAIGTLRYGWDISPDGSRIAVASSLGTFIRTIELASGSVRDVPVPADWLPQSVGWAADGKALFVTVYTPKAFLLGQVDLAGHAHVLLDKGTGQWLTQVVASPDGRYVAFGAQTWDSNVWLLENF